MSQAFEPRCNKPRWATLAVAAWTGLVMATGAGWSQQSALAAVPADGAKLPEGPVECHEEEPGLLDELPLADAVRTGGPELMPYLPVVVGGYDVTRPLSEVVAAAFPNHRRLREELVRAGEGGTALWGELETKDEVYELETVYAVHLSTVAVVARPAELARVSKVFAEYLAARPPVPTGDPKGRVDHVHGTPPGPPEIPDERARQEQMEACLAQFTENVEALPAGHPLREAAERAGVDGLRQAILEGKGRFGLEDTLVVPKVMLDRLPSGEIVGRPPSETGYVPPLPGHENEPPPPEYGTWSRGARAYVVEPESGRLHLGGNLAADLGEKAVFRWVSVSGRVVAFKSLATGRFVTVNEDGLLRVTAEEISPYEMFVPTYSGGNFRLYAFRNGKDVAADGRELRARLPALQPDPDALLGWRETQWRPTLSGAARYDAEAGLRPVSEVRVEIEDVDSGERFATRTADDGSFSFEAPRLGRKLRVSADRSGWEVLPPQTREWLTERDAEIDFQLEPIVVSSASGRVESTSDFLAGYTKGSSWRWEKKWRYPTGFFRITFHGDVGVGIRAPIRMHSLLEPAEVRVQGDIDVPPGEEVTMELSAEVFEAPAGFFRATGLRADALFGGREAVLGASIVFGTKFRVFFTDQLHIPNRRYGFDYSRDVRFPFRADLDCFQRWVIPGELTRTWFDAGILAGGLESGIRLCGNGRVDASARPYFELARMQPERDFGLEHRNDLETLETSLPEMEEHGTARYGFRLSSRGYRMDLEAQTQARLAVRVGVSGFSRKFATPWLTLLRLDVGSVSLPPHEGTQTQRLLRDGTKIFEPLPPERDPEPQATSGRSGRSRASP